jgi:hypothetical protein
LVEGKTDEQCSSVSVPTKVGRKTFGLCPDVPTSTLVEGKIDERCSSISTSVLRR